VDIKDFILIGGGLLIAAVVAHGFWIAWRARREPLRLDIRPDIVADNDLDDIDRLRGELPNGGARVITRATVGEQVALELETAPILLEPTPGAPERRPPFTPTAALREPPQKRHAAVTQGAAPTEGTRPARVEPTAGEVQQRAKVAEVVMSDAPIRADGRTGSAAGNRTTEPARSRRPAARNDADKAADQTPEATPIEELIVMNVLARRGAPFTGDQVFAALRGKGLKFGDMNIFHRIDAMNRRVNYSVANVVEPGTFDMADMESFRSPGLCFFLQLPGPDHPARVFEDMLSVARDVATELDGEFKDEQRSFMTPQTIEHYRQRIADFSRRRMSKRA